MIAWAAGGTGARLCTRGLHDDAQREFAYCPAAGVPACRIGTVTGALYDETEIHG